MNRFDQAAKTWDSNPVHGERSEAIAQKILQKIDLQPGFTALEYGAGTGILSFLLKDYLEEITLMDNSSEMLKVIEEKIHNSQTSHLKTELFNLETDEYTTGTFDLIYTQMVLHHVADINRIITQFYHILNKNGHIAIADLYQEDGSFHGNGSTIHNGFNVEELSQTLSAAGFKDISHEQCFLIKKTIETGENKEFPVFLMTASK